MQLAGEQEKLATGGWLLRAKLAVTLFASVMAIAHVVEAPAQAPDQPVKIEPGAAVAAKVTDVPEV